MKQENKPLAFGRCFAALMLGLMLAGCSVFHPDFLEHSQRDCERGDREACSMLAAMNPPKVDRTVPPRPTQVQMDVDAIMRGMRQARSSSTTRRREPAPSPDAGP